MPPIGASRASHIVGPATDRAQRMILPDQSPNFRRYQSGKTSSVFGPTTITCRIESFD